MSRSVDLHPVAGNAQGIDMLTLSRKTFSVGNSPASGVTSSGLSDGSNHSVCPGASLGTGSNTDLYTPGIEAV